jgi:histone demethylase JARID1
MNCCTHGNVDELANVYHQQRFHFRTRRQELNSVEGGNRVNNDYLDQLAKFHKQNGHNLNRFPSVDKRPLDLYRLKKTVERKGGFEGVCKGKRWAEVGRDLGYSGKIMSSLSTSLKNSYQKWLLPYEEYLRVAKPGVQHQMEMLNGGPYTPSPGPSPAKRPPGSTPQEHTPTLQASAALHASLNGHAHSPMQSPFPFAQPQFAPPQHHTPQHHTPQPMPPHHAPQPVPQHHTPQPAVSLPQPPSTGGFTPVNAGGFTPVNAGGFTSVNAAPAPLPAQTSGFTSVNGVNGFQPSNGTPQPPQQPPHQPQHGIEAPPPNNQQFIAPHPNGVAALKRQHSELTPDEIELMNRRSKRLRKDVPTVTGSNMHHSRMSSARFQAVRDRVDFKPGEMCETCGRGDDPQRLLKCESCDNVYHMGCLDPPRVQPPEHEWHCPRCLVGTNEYGFEEGDVYSLAGFQRKANEFKTYHFTSSIPRQFSPFNENKRHLVEDDVEREFWRLVDDLSDTTEVEYGADIHSTTHGSGFPTIEKHPRDSYAIDPWNLNILPLDKESLFRHIKSDISGMTVPWLYVGMVFSTFCWHNEDHFTYSANYQHFGETKTWYGIPGEDTAKFEQALKDDMPELFETQPDLLFQLVTLAKPDKLRKAGVRVYAVDQHAGEFVVTFPKAYHAGFNHGFNFNEAVNFAPADWEPFGEEGVKRLRDFRKQPCFSHDELLLTAASRDQTIRTARWLAPALERMRDDELATRQQFLSATASAEGGTTAQEPYQGPRYQHRAEIIDPATEEEEVICTFCKSYCYLSRYVCKNSGKVLCLLHAGSYECCDALETERYSGQSGNHVLCYRMTDDALKTVVRKSVDKASIPETWAAKVDSELEENARPSLKHLRTLLAEGEKIQYELPQLADLRRFVDRCNEWVEEATSYITRKQTNRRKSEKSSRKSTAKMVEAEERDKELRKVSNIQNLLSTADKIGFDCPEITTLRERAENIEEFQKDAKAAIGDILSRTTADFEELVERGRDFHVDMPEMDQLERVLKRLRWNDAGKAKRPNAETAHQEQTLSEIEGHIKEGEELLIPDTNPDMAFFREHKAQGELWEQKAKELMAVEQVHYQQLDALSRQASTLPVTPETLAAVDAILKKQREVQDKIQSLVERSKDPEFRNRPHYREMKEVMDALDELQSKPNGTIDLEKESKRHEDWMRRGKKLFGKANAPLHILHQHMNTVDKRNESCFDLTDKPRGPVEPSSRAATPEEGEGAPQTEGSSSSRDVFCICRRSEAGMMIECELCHEWYHGKCLKIARGKVKEDDKYTCPICDWRVKIPRDAARPRLEDLQAWQDELETLPFQPEEEKTLANICDYGQSFREFIKPYVEPAMPPTADEVGVLRFYLRKIEGADILLAEETNYLRRELHKFAPVAPIAPPVIEASGSTRKPRPTKQQKLMASLGITNPDHLPTQYKMKPHVAKRKQSSAMGPGTGTLNPGMSASPTGSATPGPSGPSSYQSGGAQPLENPPRKFKHMTALALHVLEGLAGNAIVDHFLASEPHANRDRLLKVKAVLEMNDPTAVTDLETFKARMASLPAPAAHNPGHGYETPSERTTMVNNVYGSQPMFTSASNDSYPATAAQSSRLGSPAQFSYPAPPGGSPSQNFDPSLFDNGSGDMFESPATTRAEEKESNTRNSTSPGFSGRPAGNGIPSGMPAGMFDSPKQSQLEVPTTHGGFASSAGISSPGFGDSQQSAGANMDSVFADLVHDQDEGMGGMEGANNVARPTTETDAQGSGTIAEQQQAPSQQQEAVQSETQGS